QRCVVGLVTGGGSQLPLPWYKGTPCCWADAGAGTAPARAAAIVSLIDTLVTTNSCLCRLCKETPLGEMRFLDHAHLPGSDRPANQAPSNQPSDGARTSPTTTRVDV